MKTTPKGSPERITAILLALLTLLSAFCLASCGDTPDTPAPQTTAKTAESQTPDESGEETTGYTFEKMDYNQQPFVVWQRDYNASSYKSMYIANFTEDISDPMSQEVMKRNNKVEEYYNVVLDVRNGLSMDQFSIQLAGGDMDVDVILGMKNAVTAKIIAGELQPFDDLDVDYSTPWWHDRAFIDLEVAGNHYLAANDISIYRFCGARFFYWNKRIVEDYHLDNPYDLMKKNQWDIDHFLNMISSVSTDNGFASLGEYGLLLETGAANGVHAHLATGCGIYLTTVDADGNIVPALEDNLEKTDTLFGKLKTVFNNMYSVLDFSTAQALDTQGEGSGESNMYNWGRKLFANGHFLFTQTNIASSSQFIEMKDEYGVAPNPKYNADQENYIHKDDSNSLIFAIPNSANIDLTRLGRILDYWAFISHDTVMTEYYEITIKTKRAYEPEAGQVIDIVKDTTMTEITECMGGIGLSTALNDGYTKGSVTSVWAAQKESVLKKLEPFNDWEPY